MDVRDRKNVVSTRLLKLGDGCCLLPERLLIAHGRGDVLLVTGAGTSVPAGLPDFRDLTLDIYKGLDRPLYNVISKIPRDVHVVDRQAAFDLQDYQVAEAKRFAQSDFDVALGMLERRLDQDPSRVTAVRRAIIESIRRASLGPAEIHHSIVALADRGGATAIVTTNFDLLLEQAAKQKRKKLATYALSGIPRPGKDTDFSGVLHIHGALAEKSTQETQCIVTDRDFGEYYLRRQVVPEFVYDAARLFQLVLIGYTANDPPMRYLLNAVAADGTRFTDLKKRYAFVPYRDCPDPVVLRDWRARGIEPIPYDERDNHRQLAVTLSAWSKFSAINGDQTLVDKVVMRIVKKPRRDNEEHDRDLFDHLYRRGSNAERRKLALLTASAGAKSDWLTAMIEIDKEHRMEVSA